MGINVSLHRKKFGIKYPALYADESHISKDCKKEDIRTFNCAQRAHQNTLESLVGVQLQGALIGFIYPNFSAACLAIYAVGRVVYCIGYTSKGPEGRMAGGIISHIGDLPLLLCTAYCRGADQGLIIRVANSRTLRSAGSNSIKCGRLLRSLEHGYNHENITQHGM